MAKSKPQVSIRRPPNVEPDPKAMEQFISGQSQPPAPTPSPEVQMPLETPRKASRKASKADPTQGRGIVQRQSGKAQRRMTVYLEPKLARSFAIYCASQGQSISDTLSEAVSMFLEAKGEL